MLRAEALETIYPDLQDHIVVTIMGAVAAELYTLGHRHNFFYLEHAMGLASSMGLGIALAMPGHKVVVLDGDGSLLMNLGTLSTMARYRPGNLLHLVFDNESLLSVGGFPTATATGTDLAGIARASGVPRVADVSDPFTSRLFSFTVLSPMMMKVPPALLKPTPLRVTVLPVATKRAPPSI